MSRGIANPHQRAGGSVPSRLSECTPAELVLIRSMATSPFAAIHGLEVCQGQPVFGPGTRVLRRIRLGAPPAEPVAERSTDFALKRHVVALLVLCRAIGDGVIDEVLVEHGLPTSVRIADLAVDDVSSEP